MRFWDDGNRELFWLVGAARQRTLLEQQIEAFAKAKEYQGQMMFNVVFDLIRDSYLGDDAKLQLVQRMQGIAAGHKNAYMQARAASVAVALNPNWAIKLMWSILPADRGELGKKTYIDWTPPPSDAGDAIRWLRRDERPKSRQQLFAALWGYLEMAPKRDQPHIRAALASWLIEEKQWEAANALVQQIEDPLEQSYLTLNLLGSGEGPP